MIYLTYSRCVVTLYHHSLFVKKLAGVCFVMVTVMLHSQKRNTFCLPIEQGTSVRQCKSCLIHPADTLLSTGYGRIVSKQRALQSDVSIVLWVSVWWRSRNWEDVTEWEEPNICLTLCYSLLSFVIHILTEWLSCRNISFAVVIPVIV